MQINDILVSIIIPAYNVEKYIEKCLISVENQDYKFIDIIIVNDGSTDKTKDIIEKFCIKDTRFRTFNIKNSGVSAARNIGLSQAKGKYVIFLDGDDYLSQKFVSSFLQNIVKSKADFFFSTKWIINNNQNEIINSKINIVTPQQAIEILLNPDVIVGANNKIYRTSFLKQNNILFKTNLFYGEGLNFIIQTAFNSKAIAYNEDCLYYYRKNNENSATRTLNINKYINGEKSLLNIQKSYIVDLNAEKSFKLHMMFFYLGYVCLHDKHTINGDSFYKKSKLYLSKNINEVIKYKKCSLKRKLVLILSKISIPLVRIIYNKKNRIKIKKSIR